MSIPGLEGDAPQTPSGMLDDLWEEGSLRLGTGQYVQRDWNVENAIGYQINSLPWTSKGQQPSAYTTAAANDGLVGEFAQNLPWSDNNTPDDESDDYLAPYNIYIVSLNLQVTVNDTGGGLTKNGPLDLYVGEGLAAESAFAFNRVYSPLYVLVPENP